ncbi:hypothetical protein RBSH_01005 [Rhodopirellula baltica SH28]|uniref:Uncharacterized protein n=1 Tax=Rhodopirellula baltica SH28 TaxID=993517 RepID=K5ECF0_RHOBT|nr:hypothetical protein RBSH_01005 [Rhodopirellula baltica SH28]
MHNHLVNDRIARTFSGNAVRHAKHFISRWRRDEYEALQMSRRKTSISTHRKRFARSDQENGLGMKAERCLNR